MLRTEKGVISGRRGKGTPESAARGEAARPSDTSASTKAVRRFLRATKVGTVREGVLNRDRG